MKKLFDNALLCLWRALLFSPVVLLAGELLPGASQLSAGLFYLGGQALALGVSFVPSRARVAALLAGGAAYAAAGALALGAPGNPMALVIVALGVVAYALTVRAEGTGVRYDTRLMIAGALIHAVAPLVIQFSGMSIDYTAMMWAGIAFLLMCPYALNDSSVREGMSLRGRGGKPIRRISRANRVMVTCLIAVALIIACAGAIRDAFQRAGAFVMHWVGRFIMWLMSLAAGSEGAGGGEGGGNMDLGLGGEAVEPSWFAKFMEQVMKYFVVLVLIVLVIFVLWKLGKLMARLARRISAWARRFAQGVKEDYLEEHEQLMDWGEVRGEMLNSVKDTLRRLTTREKKWGDMDARERVRYVMRQLYRRRGAGISGIEYLSAQEALGEMAVDEPARRELGQLYDEARYSDHEITEAQAEAARRAVK